MKPKFLTAILAILCFAFTASAGISKHELPASQMAFQSVKQTTEDCFTAVLAPNNAPTFHTVSPFNVLGNYILSLEKPLESFLFGTSDKTAAAINQLTGTNTTVAINGMDGFTKQTYRKVWSVISDFYGSKRIVTQGDLHLITSLGTADASTSNINFTVFPNSAVTTPEGSQQLNTSDAFFALQHSFAVAHTTTAALVNKAEWEYFPNAYVFTDADELAAMKQLYATGRYSVMIDSKVYYQNYLVSRFQQASVAQKGLVLTTGGANPYSLSETDGDVTAVRDLIPTMFFNGDSNIEIKITTPTTAQLGGNGTTYNWAAMNYHGFSISGGKIDQAAIPGLMAKIRAAIYS